MINRKSIDDHEEAINSSACNYEKKEKKFGSDRGSVEMNPG
jgi:hypothetical protein